MGMGIDDTIGNGNGKEWESACMVMVMSLIPMVINSHRQMQCLAYVIVTHSLLYNGNRLQYTLHISVHTHHTIIMTEIIALIQ